jgi:acetoin utilization protein AcuB
MRIYEIMTSNVQTAPVHESAERAWELMRSNRIHHLVVLRNKEVVGIVTDRDLGGARGASLRANRTVEQLMTPHVVSAGPKTTVREAANLLRGRSVGCLPVIERGRILGIVTVSDLLDLIGRGVERPVAKTRRWTLKHRGLRRKTTFLH